MYKAPWQRWIGSEAGRNNKKRYTQTQYKNIDKNEIRPQKKDLEAEKQVLHDITKAGEHIQFAMYKYYEPLVNLE